jgi:hypothetical protein
MTASDVDQQTTERELCNIIFNLLNSFKHTTSHHNITNRSCACNYWLCEQVETPMHMGAKVLYAESGVMVL